MILFVQVTDQFGHSGGMRGVSVVKVSVTGHFLAL